jgi:hypothetical protein
VTLESDYTRRTESEQMALSITSIRRRCKSTRRFSRGSDVPTMFSNNYSISILSLMAALLCLPAAPARGGDIVLNFSDVPPGTLSIFNPYTRLGFQLTSTSGGFVFNSPDTGNGALQTVGNNAFYAGADGLAAFAPATITLTQQSGDPFSLRSIDLARNFAFDPAPRVPFTGTLAGGGTVNQMLMVTTSSPPLTFQTFDLTAFTNVISVSWEQDDLASEGVHQFGNIHLFTGAVPEPASLALLSLGISLTLAYTHHSRLASSRRKRNGALAIKVPSLSHVRGLDLHFARVSAAHGSSASTRQRFSPVLAGRTICEFAARVGLVCKRRYSCD